MMTFVLLSVLLASCFGSRELIGTAKSTNLVLTEQELRFAGTALRSVLASNVNAYRRQGSRRFSGTFTIVEKENQCGFDVRINADVEVLNANGKRYPNNNYAPSSGNNNNYSPNNFGNAGRGNVGTGGGSGSFGYAGQFNY